MAQKLRIGAMAGLLASASMTMTPAQAAPMPGELGNVRHNALYTSFEIQPPGDTLSEVNEWRRWGRWRGRGWRRGWRGRRGVRAGDVLAGVAIIGGIAAIASAANNNNDRRDRRDRRRDRDRDWQQDQELRELREQNREQQRELEYLRSRGVDVETYRGRGAQERLPQTQQIQPQPQARAAAPITIDGAISTCSDVVSRDGRLGDINGVERSGDSWSVRGTINNGEPFTCRVSRDGQIEALDFSNGFRSGSVSGEGSQPAFSDYRARAEGQLSDNSYANARIAMADRNDPREPLSSSRYSPRASGAQPAYPGGPVAGEAIPENRPTRIDGDL